MANRITRAAARLWPGHEPASRRRVESAVEHQMRWIGAGIALAVGVVVLFALGWWWSHEPAPLDPVPSPPPGTPGVATTDALIDVASVLLDKPGGYLRNDVMPPGVMLDNMPSWEYGALVQLRALAQVLRNEISRPQSQSSPDPDLSIAQPRFNVNSRSWILPSDEGAYGEGIARLKSYRDRLEGKRGPPAFFQPRAKNLTLWLEIVSRRLGGISERLRSGASPTPMEGTGGAGRSSQTTSWWQTDDVFYTARGMTWALLALCRGVESDFHDVLVDKNALSTFHNLEHTLAQADRPMRSPIVLSGGGFGILASHDLTMASYLSSANNIVQTLENLMQND